MHLKSQSPVAHACWQSKCQRMGLAAFVLLAAILPGCREEDGISVYSVSKADVSPRAATSVKSTAASEQQMLAAIVPQGDAAWFFKIKGQPSVVAKLADEFRQIVDSVTYSETGVPSWELPQGWSDQLSTGMTYAKWTHSESGLEATITSLPVIGGFAGKSGWQDYVVENVNRWRGQLALPHQAWDAMASELEEFPDVAGDDRPAYYVSLSGTGSGGMRGPFMGAGMGGSPPQTPNAGSATADGGAGKGSGSGAVDSQKQMLAAIVPNGESAWFFKLTGQPDVVATQADAFRAIVDSVKFSDAGKPSWELTEGWSDELSTGMTYAKWTHTESGLQATATPLPVIGRFAGESGWQNYIVENVNRWRGQLALEHQDWDAMAKELEGLPGDVDGDRTGYFVNLTGTGSGGMRGPFMGGMIGGGSAKPPAAEPAAKEAAEAKAPEGHGYTFELPEGWTEEKPSSGFRQMQFAVNRKGDSADVEVIVSRAGGEIQSNMKMWYSQVEAKVSDEAIAETIAAASMVVINGIESKVYRVEGDGVKSIALAEIPVAAGQSRYIKMVGASDAVEAQQESFVAFLESLTW